MQIVMMTNTYLPMVGGVSRSVAGFTQAFRTAGHRVLVVAPTFPGQPPSEEDVVRMPAIQRFHGSEFSVGLPVPGALLPTLERFRPDIIHAHHPFLLGDTALRSAAHFNVPAVFTHHTMYEQYTHYVPGNSPAMRQFAAALATEFANLCDHVIAPSGSVAKILRSRGVTVPITAIATGIDLGRFATGQGSRGRVAHGMPPGAHVVGHVGRLAAEKNLGFLARAVARVLRQRPDAWFLVVGSGPAEAEIRSACEAAKVAERLRMAGRLDNQDLADAYAAMDVFVFGSLSETQGLVLAEAMAAGTPVVAIDAPGVRDVVIDGVNGRLLDTVDEEAFANATVYLLDLPTQRWDDYRRQARATAASLAMPVCAERVLRLYEGLLGGGHRGAIHDPSLWAAALRRLDEEWSLLAGKSAALLRAEPAADA